MPIDILSGRGARKREPMKKEKKKLEKKKMTKLEK
jgi:hypothetical protein